MTFNSSVFLFLFLPVAVLVNLCIKKEIRVFWLLFCSIFFYAWAQPQFLWLIFGIILIDYICAFAIEKVLKPKVILVLSIILNLSGLIFFKYWKSVLPLGISFYTFKGISYISDVYLKKIPPERNIAKLSTYIIMFPQIISGPIDSYDRIKPGLDSNPITTACFREGINRFIFGLSQKTIIANTLGVVVDNIWTMGAGAVSWKTAWFGSIAYSLQIYFDFAGYSNMAVGIGKMLGFQFSENFNLPYISRSITEFWRRWHITLGEWFKKYIYIPLGGNRRSNLRGYFNLAAVFLLTGIWHGASWTFLLWGAIHGMLRILEKLVSDKKFSINAPAFIKNIVKHIYCLFFVNLCWVLFRAPDIKNAFFYIQAMFGRLNSPACGISVREYLTRWNVFVFALALILSTSLPRKIADWMKKKMNNVAYVLIRDVLLLLMFAVSVSEVVTNTYKTFIYFQF